MATNAGTIVVNIRAQTDKFSRGIKKAQSSLKGFGRSTKQFIADNKLAISIGVGVFVAGIAKVTKAASDLEETQGKFNTVFRGSTKVAEEFATELQSSFATSEEEAKRFLSTIQDTLVPMGLMRDEATKISGATVKLAADLGSFNNLPTEQVVKAIQSAMVGNLETVRKFGISLRAATIDQAILDKGIATSTKTITEAQRVTERLAQITAGSADAIGDMARTSQSFANRLKKLNSEATNLMATLGQFTIGPGGNAVSKLTEMATATTDVIKQIQSLAGEFKSFGDFLKANFIAAIGSVILAVLDIISMLPLVGLNMKLIGVDLDKVKSKIEDVIISAQSSLNTSEFVTEKFVEGEQKKQEAIVKTKDVTIEAAKEKKETLFEFDTETFKDNVEKAQKRLEMDKKVSEFFLTSRKEMTDFAVSQANRMFDQFGNGVADMIMQGRRFADIMKSIWKDLARAVIAEIAKMIAKWIAFQILTGGSGGGFSAASRFFGGGLADGGIISEPSVITGLRSGITRPIGEAGPEVVLPVSSFGKGGENGGVERFKDGDAEKIAGGTGGGNALTVNVSISGMFIDGNENKWQRLVRDRIVPEIQRFTMSRPIGPFNRKKGVV